MATQTPAGKPATILSAPPPDAPASAPQAQVMDMPSTDTEIGKMLSHGTTADADLREIIDNMKSKGMSFSANGAFVHARETHVDTGHLTKADLQRFGIGPGWTYKWIHSEEYDRARGKSPTTMDTALASGRAKLVLVNGKPVRNRSHVLLKVPQFINDARDNFIRERKQRMLGENARVVTRETAEDAENPIRETPEERAQRQRRDAAERQAAARSITRGAGLKEGLNRLCDEHGLPRTDAGRAEVVRLSTIKTLEHQFPGMDFRELQKGTEEKPRRTHFVMPGSSKE
jgi:hypothetical protein